MNKELSAFIVSLIEKDELSKASEILEIMSEEPTKVHEYVQPYNPYV